MAGECGHGLRLRGPFLDPALRRVRYDYGFCVLTSTGIAFLIFQRRGRVILPNPRKFCEPATTEGLTAAKLLLRQFQE